jgi:hypothetical protein
MQSIYKPNKTLSQFITLIKSNPSFLKLDINRKQESDKYIAGVIMISTKSCLIGLKDTRHTMQIQIVPSSATICLVAQKNFKE